MKRNTHTPVLMDEVIELLNLRPGDTFVDGTVGLGGHAAAVCKLIAPDGLLLAIDKDNRNLKEAKKRLLSCGVKVIAVNDSYANLKEIAYEHAIDRVSGVLLDLGYASTHVENADRGFSFGSQGPLDMRYDTTQDLTAYEIINSWPEEDIAEVLRVYGEEKFAKKIANHIKKARKKEKFTTTTQLAEFVSRIVSRSGRQRIHPATRVFQALRIAVNDELGELKRVLPEIVSLLEPGGRLAVISFHSLEDRIVKRFIAEQAKLGVLKKINKKVVTGTREEILSNPRARSAKLRVAEKYGGDLTDNSEKECPKSSNRKGTLH